MYIFLEKEGEGGGGVIVAIVGQPRHTSLLGRVHPPCVQREVPVSTCESVLTCKKNLIRQALGDVALHFPARKTFPPPMVADGRYIR